MDEQSGKIIQELLEQNRMLMEENIRLSRLIQTPPDQEKVTVVESSRSGGVPVGRSQWSRSKDTLERMFKRSNVGVEPAEVPENAS